MNALATTTLPPGLERYRAQFEVRGYADSALTALRRSALEQFLATGFPTQRDERWKYTNLRRLESRSFVLADPSPVAPDASRWLEGGHRLVLVDGHFMPSLSTHSAYPPGVTVLTIRQWSQHSADEVASFLSQTDRDGDSAFAALNTAFLEDGVIIDIAADTRLDEPLYVVHQWQTSGRAAHPRIIVRAGRNSHCTLIEHYVGTEGLESFTNAVVTIDAGQGARVAHYRLQQEAEKTFHIGTVRARIDRDAHYSIHDISLGATLARSDIGVALNGESADAKLRGLFVPLGAQHLDNYTLIEHVAPHTTSEEEYRGIAGGKGRGIFNGKIKVHANAQKIDARQLSRNLLLSPGAEIDTKPELEIYANDVKCSHGATTGQLDAAALFYLRSRGLDPSEARHVLIRAFAESILASIEPKSLHGVLERALRDRFAAVEAGA